MNGTKFVSLHVTAANQARDVRLFLDALEAQDVNDWQTTIVDRASQGGDVLDGRTPNPDVVVLRNFNDQGFCRAQNQALALALSRFPAEELASRVIVVAHPDIVFAPDAIRKIMEAFSADPDLMIGVPPLHLAKRVMGDDMERLELETSEVVETVGLACSTSRRLKPQPSLTGKVFAPSDICAVFRASALAEAKTQVGWFDPALPDTQAMVDLAWRLRLRGMKLAVLPEVKVWHTPHGETRTGFARFKKFWSAASRKERLDRQTGCLCAKNDLFVNRLIHVPWLFGAWVARLGLSVVDPAGFLERMKWLPTWFACWSGRDETMKQRRVSSGEARSWFV